MKYEPTEPSVYSNDDILRALEAFAAERNLDNRFDAMRVVVVQALEAAGYLKPQPDPNFLSTMSDDTTF